jgi:septum formation protein
MLPPMLILASRSPRRAQLLDGAGYQYRQITPAFEDPAQPESLDGQSAMQLAQQLARQKAESCRSTLQDPDSDAPNSLKQNLAMLLLSADTICVDHQGQLIGQPQSPIEARAMIESFMGRSHEVITGVALHLVSGAQDESSKPICFADSASVWLDPLDRQTLEQYMAGDQWRGKAGGYNLFDRQAAGWPVRVETGDPTTVVGLPMKKLIDQLKRFNIQPAIENQVPFKPAP